MDARSSRGAGPSDGDPLVLRVNGREHAVRVPGDISLLLALRTELGLTGAKYGCGEGECGACTVLVDDRPVPACRLPVREAVGREVVTVEGLSPVGRLSAVQRAFVELGAFQCGFCTPGMIVGATALLRANPDPSDGEIRTSMNGHLCRCCGYPRIVRAIRRAAELARPSEDRP